MSASPSPPHPQEADGGAEGIAARAAEAARVRTAEAEQLAQKLQLAQLEKEKEELHRENLEAARQLELLKREPQPQPPPAATVPVVPEKKRYIEPQLGVLSSQHVFNYVNYESPTGEPILLEGTVIEAARALRNRKADVELFHARQAFSLRAFGELGIYGSEQVGEALEDVAQELGELQAKAEQGGDEPLSRDALVTRLRQVAGPLSAAISISHRTRATFEGVKTLLIDLSDIYELKADPIKFNGDQDTRNRLVKAVVHTTSWSVAKGPRVRAIVNKLEEAQRAAEYKTLAKRSVGK